MHAAPQLPSYKYKELLYWPRIYLEGYVSFLLILPIYFVTHIILFKFDYYYLGVLFDCLKGILFTLNVRPLAVETILEAILKNATMTSAPLMFLSCFNVKVTSIFHSYSFVLLTIWLWWRNLFTPKLDVYILPLPWPIFIPTCHKCQKKSGTMRQATLTLSITCLLQGIPIWLIWLLCFCIFWGLVCISSYTNLMPNKLLSKSWPCLECVTKSPFWSDVLNKIYKIESQTQTLPTLFHIILSLRVSTLFRLALLFYYSFNMVSISKLMQFSM